MARKKSPMKKLPAVREAVKTLGVEAPVAQVREWIKEKYNLDLTDGTAQTYVGVAKREMRDGTPGKVKRAKAAPRAMPKVMGNGLAIDQVIGAVTTLRGLVGVLGKENLLKLVEAL